MEKETMDRKAFEGRRQFAQTSVGDIAYVEHGEGPAALFCHGAALNGYQWRGVIDRCADVRRVIAFDNLGHGHTRAAPDADVDFAGHARMLAELLDGLGVERVDLVGNDSGGAIAQVFAAQNPDRVRSLALANCDAKDSTPPPSLLPLLELVRQGGLADMWKFLLDNPDQARTPETFGGLYENPEQLSDETIEAYLAPVVADMSTVHALERFLLALASDQIAVIEPQLRELRAPTLIVWGTADTAFDLKLAYWLAETIPGARPVVEIEGGKLFWPEEHPDRLAELLVAHWSGAS
jgi:pimeloyl-ACP methyl ester carboxylesterase